METISVTINPKTDTEPRRIIIEHGTEDANMRVTTSTTAHGNAETILVWSLIIANFAARVYQYIPYYRILNFAGLLCKVAVETYENPEYVRKG